MIETHGLVSFDLEIVDDIPEDTDWQELRPLGVSCAALAVDTVNEPQVITFSRIPQMSRSDAIDCFHVMESLVQRGRTLVTWNGTRFDFPVLADLLGGDYRQAMAELALQHVDLMMIVTFTKGWYLGLEAALQGAGLEGKRKEVMLSDGSVLTEMSGAKAPELWRAGETDAVIRYLHDDVLQLLELAGDVLHNGSIIWTSRSGNHQQVNLVEDMVRVKDLWRLPVPDTSWMSDPPTRESFVDWMPASVLEGAGIELSV